MGKNLGIEENVKLESGAKMSARARFRNRTDTGGSRDHLCRNYLKKLKVMRI